MKITVISKRRICFTEDHRMYTVAPDDITDLYLKSINMTKGKPISIHAAQTEFFDYFWEGGVDSSEFLSYFEKSGRHIVFPKEEVEILRSFSNN